VVAEDRSEPKLAVVDRVKLESVRVDVSVGVVWKVLVIDKVKLESVMDVSVGVVWKVLVDVGIACNALELAAAGGKVGSELSSKRAHT